MNQSTLSVMEFPEIFHKEVEPAFTKLKPILDKYPNSFRLVYSPERGHIILVNYDLLDNHQGIVG